MGKDGVLVFYWHSYDITEGGKYFDGFDNSQFIQSAHERYILIILLSIEQVSGHIGTFLT